MRWEIDCDARKPITQGRGLNQALAPQPIPAFFDLQEHVPLVPAPATNSHLILRSEQQRASRRMAAHTAPATNSHSSLRLKALWKRFAGMIEAHAVPIPSDSVLAPLCVGADLLDAFAIRLPAGASGD